MVSTSVQADRYIQVRDPDYVLNPELLANYKSDTTKTLFHYNAMGRYKFDQRRVVHK